MVYVSHFLLTALKYIYLSLEQGSSACFLLASYTSHPYVAEVARGSWGRTHPHIDARTSCLLESTDPATAQILRYGDFSRESREELESMLDHGLGRVMRLTRLADCGLTLLQAHVRRSKIDNDSRDAELVSQSFDVCT